MKKTILIALILVALLVGYVYWGKAGENILNPDDMDDVATTTDDGVESQTVSDGTLSFSYPNDFGLAVNKNQILVKSYIPPCSEDFDYCLYYNGKDFADTNFESAGVRISKRADLKEENKCLTTAPEGYPGMGGSSALTSTYSASIFAPIGDAAAGHYASGEIYRVYVKEAKANKCYELETRIGETQFANYPVGTKVKFDEGDRDLIYAQFRSILGSLKIASTTERIILPDSEN